MCQQNADNHRGALGLHHSTPERKNADCSCPCVSDLPVDGANCLMGKKSVLPQRHSVQFRFAPTTAKVCVNGTLTTMEVPSDYTTPERKSAECPCNPICKNKKGKLTYCNEDEVPPKPNRSTLKRQWGWQDLLDQHGLGNQSSRWVIQKLKINFVCSVHTIKILFLFHVLMDIDICAWS
jgi:hypothetical protein